MRRFLWSGVGWLLFVGAGFVVPSWAQVPATFQEVASDPAYQRLQHALIEYQKLANHGGWPQTPDGPKLETGSLGDRIVALRRRLAATGEWKHGEGPPQDRYDEALAEAVRRFQARHGLEEDGKVGRETLKVLNIPVEKRIEQIEINLARWGEFSHDPTPRFVRVNIPAFQLDFVEQGQPTLTMRVVVGRKDWQTPTLDALMTHVVFNPKWHVPAKIAMQEVIHDIRKDPDYLTKKKMRVFVSKQGKPEEVDPGKIDWSSESENFHQYSFRQDSGDANALGRIKFLFPNKYDVYLHDTPSKSFFQRAMRALSHGCMRVQKPLDLADKVFAGDPHWSRDKVKAAIGRGTEQFVKLQESIPVHLYYRTAWVDEEGTVQFRDDIYGLDKKWRQEHNQ